MDLKTIDTADGIGRAEGSSPLHGTVQLRL